MGWLIAGMLDGLGIPSGLAGDTTPYVPSVPVQIGTSVHRHSVSEAGSWQVLLVMLVLVLILGTAVLLYAVRQRTRVLARRRVRRMGEAAALRAGMEATAGAADDGAVAGAALGPLSPPRTTSAKPGRPAPNA